MEKPLYTCAQERIMCVLHLCLYKHAHVLVQACMCHGACAKVKGQLWMSILPFPLFETVFVTARARLTSLWVSKNPICTSYFTTEDWELQTCSTEPGLTWGPGI